MKMSGTSRRPHVATSPRRDVGSTTMQVNKKQRRDVHANAVFSSFKSKQEEELEVSGNVRTRDGNQSSSDIDLEEEPVICIVSSFLTIELMFYISHISILLDSMF